MRWNVKYDLDAIREKFDLRTLYPQNLIRERNPNKEWIQALCAFHDDQSPSMRVGRQGFRCMAASCGVHGDLFYYTQLTEAVDFITAVKILSDNKPTAYVPPERPRVKIVAPPQFSWDEVLRFKSGMTAEDYAYLEQNKGVQEWAADKYNVGSLPLIDSEHSDLYTIPITEEDGSISDVKVYNPKSVSKRPKYWHLKNGAHTTLAYLNYLEPDTEEVHIAGGEKEWLVFESNFLPAIAPTGGESCWKPEWTRKLERFKKVWVCLDSEPAGEQGSKAILKAAPFVHVVNFGLAGVHSFSEFIRKNDVDDFENLKKECKRRYG